MELNEKVEIILRDLQQKVSTLAEDLDKEANRATALEEGMLGLGVFLLMLDAQHIADVLQVVHADMNLLPSAPAYRNIQQRGVQPYLRSR